MEEAFPWKTTKTSKSAKNLKKWQKRQNTTYRANGVITSGRFK
jgi:hypothetical protein